MIKNFNISYWFFSLLCLLLGSCIQPITDTTHVSEMALTDVEDYRYQWSPNGESILLSRPRFNMLYAGKTVNGPMAWIEIASSTIVYLPHKGHTPLWSPDGSAIMFSSGNYHAGSYQIFLFQIANQRLVDLPSLPGIPTAWFEKGVYYEKPDGRWRADLNWSEIINQDRAPVWSEEQLIFAYDATKHNIPWMAPDGEHMAVLEFIEDDAETFIQFVSLDGQANILLETTHTLDSLGNCCEWSPDGMKFAFASFDPHYGLYLIDLVEGQIKEIMSSAQIGDGRILSLDFSPDSQQIAFEWSERDNEPMALNSYNNPFANTQIYIADIQSQKIKQLTKDGSGTHNKVRWSPNGNQLSFRRDDRTWLADLSSTQPITTVSVDFSLSQTPQFSEATQKELAGLTIFETDNCPSQIALSPDKNSLAESLDSFPIPIDVLNEYMLYGPFSQVPFRRLLDEEMDMNTSFGFLNPNGTSWRYYTISYGGGYTIYPPILSLEAATLSEYTAEIFAVAKEVKSTSDIICYPPRIMTIGEIDTLLIEHKAQPSATIPIANSLIWQEEDSLWRLSALAPGSGGKYSVDDLISIAHKLLDDTSSD